MPGPRPLATGCQRFTDCSGPKSINLQKMPLQKPFYAMA
ncbi:hypothetical protein PY32053_01900 [Paracoccus yeei]|uniref:Uncharacterized protein n=1 Tax=Paracoccus yeei TaxID=147645 RepID=A0A386ULD9_9RHOB|nr:hypothetical protein PY32053_01900 [Paracoccus yeei]